jgi:hypothetical protein
MGFKLSNRIKNVNFLPIENKPAFLERAVTGKLIIIKNSRMECFCRDLNEVFDLKNAIMLKHTIFNISSDSNQPNIQYFVSRSRIGSKYF